MIIIFFFPVTTLIRCRNDPGFSGSPANGLKQVIESIMRNVTSTVINFELLSLLFTDGALLDRSATYVCFEASWCRNQT